MDTTTSPPGPDLEDDEARTGAEFAGTETEDLSPPVQPFFTLIEDTTSGTHHHPQVHYIFSDEDSDVLIESIQRIEQLRIESQSLATPRRNSRQNSHSGTTSTLRHDSSEERYVVVDTAADGMSVTNARSLTADWQILDASISDAPMLDGNTTGTEDDGEEQRKLMLKIVGVGKIGGATEDLATAGDGAGQSASIEDEVRGFALRMTELRKIVERAEKDMLTLDIGAQHSVAEI